MIGAMFLLALFGGVLIALGALAWMEGHPRIARIAWAIGAVHVAPFLVRVWMAAIMGVGE